MGNLTMGNLTMGNFAMGNITMGNCAMGNFAMGNFAMGNLAKGNLTTSWKPDLKDDFKFTTSVEEPSSPASRMSPSLLYVDAMKTPNEIAAFGLQEPAVIHMTFEH
ncbi:hypothetical protein Pmar_PMAR005980 [Perkinsus marinus ATCC 50983]|uniref:Uncharacterized protein n=1 Tax=Perkinsus marinus (strain ATCC 50983 / TXsc) TaxID=423536 RepID=C5L9W2_PERM5|nr:hypothetical protein Pmar_PMAR005980 [Perkinsus marinus ATCC 50983]EER06218.1 hypothetical protein Pmar_PMAR005980 [Perkinsus marinus ATCC 50983]|eukprot:XP_002774402.1 hypothetical protein Pmar_PMAR005980 [Perkinsus marinus ATCC 50983]